MEYIWFRTDIDKNVDSRKPEWGVIPAVIPALDFHPVHILRSYLRVIRPRSLHTFAHPVEPVPRAYVLGKWSRPEPNQRIDGLLLGCPRFRDPFDKGLRKFHSTPYTRASEAVKGLFLRAFPDSSPQIIRKVGSQSGRKTAAELLWANSGHDVRMVADMGHWKIERGAIDRYFQSSLEERLTRWSKLRDPADLLG
jgi:hypothetical protein